MQRRVAAIVSVDADLQPLLDRQAEERRRRRERALDRGRGHAVIDELEGAPACERRLEIARHRCIGARVAADDRGEADDWNAHLLISLEFAERGKPDDFAYFRPRR